MSCEVPSTLLAHLQQKINEATQQMNHALSSLQLVNDVLRLLAVDPIDSGSSSVSSDPIDSGSTASVSSDPIDSGSSSAPSDFVVSDPIASTITASDLIVPPTPSTSLINESVTPPSLTLLYSSPSMPNVSGENASYENASYENASYENASYENASVNHLLGSASIVGACQATTDVNLYVPVSQIKIDSISYSEESARSIQEAVLRSPPVEERLHVIIVVSNPCLYRRRYALALEFMERMRTQPDVLLYVVETVYGDQPFVVTEANHPRHLQLHAETPLWHKENMINLGVRLLPDGWKAMAWIDADIEFENVTWASDTLKILNGTCDIVQLFSHAVDMDHLGQGMTVFNSFGYQYAKQHPYVNSGINYWHPGFAWACTREAYDRMGGLYEVSILGSGDNIMALSLIGGGVKALNEVSNIAYKKSVAAYQERVKGMRLGYVPGVILHHYHGSKKNRKYCERWKILIKYDFNPDKHLSRLENGVLCPSDECPFGLTQDIMTYFLERNEDEFFSY